MALRDDPELMRKYKREWIAKRRADWFADKSCVKCGTTNNLELDHIDPKTKVHHCVWSWSKERRDVETAKCQVLCCDCHLNKTIENGDNVKIGEANVNSKLTDEIIREIVLGVREGVSRKYYIEKYDICKQHVSDIVRRRTWKHVNV